MITRRTTHEMKLIYKRFNNKTISKKECKKLIEIYTRKYVKLSYMVSK
jgi:hypothetical protein